MYKDKEAQREATKERVRRYRNKEKGVTKQGVTSEKEQGVTEPQYVTLSDGQVLRLGNHGYIGEDKFTGYQCPKGWSSWVGFQQAMKASNRAQYLEPLAIRNKVKLDKVAELLECTA